MIYENKYANALFKHKWIIVYVLLLFMAMSASTVSYIKTVNGVNPSFFELILEQTNEPQMILFPLMYLLLLFTMGGKERIEGKNIPSRLLKEAVIEAAVYMLFFIAANLFYGLLTLKSDSIFTNIWSYKSVLSGVRLSPLTAAAFSLILLFIRFSFLIYLMNFVNSLMKRSHWGFWCAFLISYIDFMLAWAGNFVFLMESFRLFRRYLLLILYHLTYLL